MNHGKIFLVGFGPGSVEHMTHRARAAIAEAEVIIGYSTYIKLVQDLLDGKTVVRKGMTEELDRCIEAYDQAREGKKVALISSGDIGIYGMAGPTFEVLFQAGWTPDDPVEVEVIPGASAFNACASLVGAPLTHDFCSISLSDLLTPWPVIARRLEAAGQADFVVALYNPKSGRRTGQIVEAQRILLTYRSPETPVAVVKSAYRRRQRVELTTLAEMADREIGMLTTVLIGNSSTFVRHGLMVTPRGYANKYDGLTGEVRSGEQAGRSLSMGLLGWHEVVRRYLAGQKTLDILRVAEHFEVPCVEIFKALAEPLPVTQPLPWRATPVRAMHLRVLLAELFEREEGWLELGKGAGIRAKLKWSATDFSWDADRWVLSQPHQQLLLDVSAFASAWFLERTTGFPELFLLDAWGNVVLVLSFLPGAMEDSPHLQLRIQALMERHGTSLEPLAVAQPNAGDEDVE
jgi:precorrin-3B C17-methyltransferase